MLLTTMHMTLLGVLVTLAPRNLFETSGFTCLGVTVDPLVDQQLGGVVMLLAGGLSYLLGGLFLLSRLLRAPEGEKALAEVAPGVVPKVPRKGRPWS
jgi:putative membrane protein